jgi:hypothetical protein
MKSSLPDVLDEGCLSFFQSSPAVYCRKQLAFILNPTFKEIKLHAMEQVDRGKKLLRLFAVLNRIIRELKQGSF